MQQITDEQKIEILRYNNAGMSSRQIENLTGVSKSAVSRFLSRSTHKEWWDKNQNIAAGTLSDHRDKIHKFTEKTFILTCAQNNTYVNDNFLKTLENIAQHRNAKILVSSFYYNLNGFQNGSSDDDWFDPKIKQYLHNEPGMIAKDLLWCGELNILPTAVNPLSGLHSYTKNMSGVVPHVKVQLESLPRHKQHDPRFLYTTGTVTLRNYIPQKSGQKASFHHVFGALLVEVCDDGTWFARQIISDERGGVQDLDEYFTPDGQVLNQPVEAINYGDIHIEKIDQTVRECLFDKESSLLNVLKPSYQFIHDVLDFEARNHHNINDPYFRFKLHNTKRDNVENNIRQVANFLDEISRDYSSTIVVESNHDLAFSRWLKESDYKQDPENAVYFLKNQYRQYCALQESDHDFSIFEWAVRDISTLEYTTFLRSDDSFKICSDTNTTGIECGLHGHQGINGSRGAIGAYQKLGVRYNIGHSHSAAIKDGVYVAGVTGKLDMGYNAGPTSWSHSHIITYKNGKRTIITVRNGKWRR